MPVVIAVWPNNTFSLLQVPVGFSMTSLFWQLDSEADPLDAKLYMLKPHQGWSHATFDWHEGDRTDYKSDDCDYMKIKTGSGRLSSNEGKLRRIKLPHNIVRLAHRSAIGCCDADQSGTKSMTAGEISSMPAEPIETYSVDVVRAMDSFCGVYFAFNKDGSCHYVGESLDVTKRITSSRNEIGDRRIGIIKCQPCERKRIEAYFVSMLDPPGNAISTHRMREKEPADGR